MRIAILGSAKSWHVQDLLRAAEGTAEVLPISYADIISTVNSQEVAFTCRNHDLTSFDVLLVRSMPHGNLEQVVFRMNALAELSRAGVRVVNSPRAMEIAIDKYLATVRLQQAGLLVPKTITCQTVEQAMAGFAELNGEVVIKPVFGSEGRGIVRVTEEAEALQVFQSFEQNGAIYYLQEFVPHEGFDLRLFVLGDRVIGMRRCHATDWRTNISQGATPEPLEVTSELGDLALRAAQAVETEIAGVDFLPARDGKLYALEVNAVPGWQALSELTRQDVAKQVLEYLI